MGPRAGGGEALPAQGVEEWIASAGRHVPQAFRDRRAFRRCVAAAGEPASEALLGAAEAEIERCRTGQPRDREAALSLLAADAFITYACLREVSSGSGREALVAWLERTTARVAHAGWRS